MYTFGPECKVVPCARVVVMADVGAARLSVATAAADDHCLNQCDAWLTYPSPPTDNTHSEQLKQCYPYTDPVFANRRE